MIEPSTETTAVVVRETSAVGQALSVNEIIAQVNLIQNVMKAVMTDGEHYGTIPGCGNKKTLLQPGAQKLTMTFRLAPEYELQETDLPRGHKEYRVICTLKNMGNGAFVGQGVGCCSTMESKYRYRGGSRKCPDCGKEAIIKGKAEYGGGWLCFGKKGGCGAKWPNGAKEIEGQSVDRVEAEDPADFFNTVLKMAKKRAFVDATITATAASDIFTQDVGDAEEEPTPPPPSPLVVTKAPTPPAAPKKAAVAADLLPPKEASEVTRGWALGQLRAQFADDVLLSYFVEHSFILPEQEKLEDWSLGLVPTTRPACTELIAKIGEWQRKKLPPNENWDDVDSDNAPWRAFPMPYGKNAGVKLSDLDKKYLYGLWANFKVETEYNGTPKKPDAIARDQTFRVFLDDAGEHYEFTKED